MRLDPEIRALASRQYGLASSRQIRGLGATPTELRRLAQSSEWEWFVQGLLCHTASPEVPERLLLATVLAANGPAAVSFQTGAAWWGAPGYSLQPVHVTALRRHQSRTAKLGILHTATRLPEALISRERGVPVLKPAVVLLDLALEVHPAKAARLCDFFWARRWVDERSLDKTLDLIGRRGKDGTAPLRRLLDERRGRYRPPESGNERRFLDLLARSGQAAMDNQVDVGLDGWIARVDFLDRPINLVVEIDSDLHHTALVDERSDAERDDELTAAGYKVRRFTEFEVWHRGDWVVSEVARLRRELGRRPAA